MDGFMDRQICTVNENNKFKITIQTENSMRPGNSRISVAYSETLKAILSTI